MSSDAVTMLLCKEVADLAGKISALESQIRAVELLSPKPGDVILVTMPDKTTYNERTTMRNQFQRAVGEGISVCVLPERISVKIVRASDIPKEEDNVRPASAAQ